MSESKESKKPKGGKRPGAGMPKGYVTRKTLDKIAAREEARKLITQALAPMIRAQVASATGIGHVYTRDKLGKFTRITDMRKIDALLSSGTEGKAYWIFAKDPNAQAFKELMDRALDRSKEQPQELEHSGGIEISWKSSE